MNGDRHSPSALVDAFHNAVDRALREVTTADLPDLIGVLAAAAARAQARLVAPPAPVVASGELVTAEVVAERFHLALSSVHELARQGRIPCRMFGRFR